MVYDFGGFKVGASKRKVPRMMVGTSPFIGAGQFGDMADVYYREFYDQPENMTALFAGCAEMGVPAVQAVAYENIVHALKEVKKDFDVYICAVVGLKNFDLEFSKSHDMDSDAVLIHARLSDKNYPFVEEKVEILKDLGLVTGISTHDPGNTIPEEEDLDIDLIMAPVNKSGRYMTPTYEAAMKAVTESGKRVIAMKPLAAGDLTPDDAFGFLDGKVDAVAVGLTSLKEAEETFAAAEGMTWR